MDESLYFLMAGILGVVAHCIIKAMSLQKDAKAANIDFKIKDYLNDDYLGISLAFVAVALWFIISPEALVKYPRFQGWIRGSFAAVGMLGSYLLQTIFSVAKRKIRSKVDRATNELDAIKSKEEDER